MKWTGAKENHLKNDISIRGNPQIIFCREKTNRDEKICLFYDRSRKFIKSEIKIFLEEVTFIKNIDLPENIRSVFFCKDFLHRIQMFGKTSVLLESFIFVIAPKSR